MARPCGKLGTVWNGLERLGTSGSSRSLLHGRLSISAEVGCWRGQYPFAAPAKDSQWDSGGHCNRGGQRTERKNAFCQRLAVACQVKRWVRTVKQPIFARATTQLQPYQDSRHSSVHNLCRSSLGQVMYGLAEIVEARKIFLFTGPWRCCCCIMLYLVFWTQITFDRVFMFEAALWIREKHEVTTSVDPGYLEDYYYYYHYYFYCHCHCYYHYYYYFCCYYYCYYYYHSFYNCYYYYYYYQQHSHSGTQSNRKPNMSWVHRFSNTGSDTCSSCFRLYDVVCCCYGSLWILRTTIDSFIHVHQYVTIPDIMTSKTIGKCSSKFYILVSLEQWSPEWPWPVHARDSPDHVSGFGETASPPYSLCNDQWVYQRYSEIMIPVLKFLFHSQQKDWYNRHLGSIQGNLELQQRHGNVWPWYTQTHYEIICP